MISISKAQYDIFSEAFAGYNKIIGSKIFTLPGRTDEMTMIIKAQYDKFSETFAKYNKIMDS